MEKNYSFLKDERAVEEIRKHKWLESQKQNREVGFATAAVDWIKRFGGAWKQVHVREERDYTLLFERRRFRRFRVNSQVTLCKDDTAIVVKAHEMSFAGIACVSDDYIPVSREVTLSFDVKTPAIFVLNAWRRNRIVQNSSK